MGGTHKLPSSKQVGRRDTAATFAGRKGGGDGRFQCPLLGGPQRVLSGQLEISEGIRMLHRAGHENALGGRAPPGGRRASSDTSGARWRETRGDHATPDTAFIERSIARARNQFFRSPSPLSTVTAGSSAGPVRSHLRLVSSKKSAFCSRHRTRTR